MKISIIIPAWNEEKLLPRCLAAVADAAGALTARGWETEVIVVDNNSTDRTAVIAREHGATVVFEPENQIARARNRGAEAATGDWFVFVDADTWPSRLLFEYMAEAIASGRVIGGGAVVKFDNVPWDVPLAVCFWNTLSRWRKWAAGAFIFCEAEACRAIGGFSLEYYASEEIDFSRRLRKQGRKQGKRMKIITGVPILSSGRKMQQYPRRHFIGLFLRFLRHPFTMLKKKEQCDIWYDGKR